MAFVQMSFYADSIRRRTPVYMCIPNDINPLWIKDNPHHKRPTKTLVMLHGYTDFANEWVNSSLINELCNEYNIAAVMPSGDNCFYLNGEATGFQYCDYIGVELLEYIRKTFNLALKAEDTFIGGLSMGGFGAIHTGLAHPENYSKVIGLSSALIVNEVKNMKEGYGNEVANYEYFRQVFGDPAKLAESENNPEYLIKKLKENNAKIPDIFMACGTEDFLIEPNRQFRDFLKSQGVPVTYHESKGVHDWHFWNEYLEPAFKWAVGDE